MHFFKVLKVSIMKINFSRRRCKICFISFKDIAFLSYKVLMNDMTFSAAADKWQCSRVFSKFLLFNDIVIFLKF